MLVLPMHEKTLVQFVSNVDDDIVVSGDIYSRTRKLQLPLNSFSTLFMDSKLISIGCRLKH